MKSTIGKKEHNKYQKKKGVELVMKFRNHKDPLYYDPNSNDKIFVPTFMVNQNTTTLDSTSFITGRGNGRRLIKIVAFNSRERSWYFQ